MSEGTRYQALPTSEGLIPVNEELEALEPVATRKPPTSDPVDVRIRWIYFLLGCATLLPWNGESVYIDMLLALSIFCSHDYCDSFFHFSVGRYTSPSDVRLLSVKRVHREWLDVPGLLHGHIQAGMFLAL